MSTLGSKWLKIGNIIMSRPLKSYRALLESYNDTYTEIAALRKPVRQPSLTYLKLYSNYFRQLSCVFFYNWSKYGKILGKSNKCIFQLEFKKQSFSEVVYYGQDKHISLNRSESPYCRESFKECYYSWLLIDATLNRDSLFTYQVLVFVEPNSTKFTVRFNECLFDKTIIIKLLPYL